MDTSQYMTDGKLDLSKLPEATPAENRWMSLFTAMEGIAVACNRLEGKTAEGHTDAIKRLFNGYYKRRTHCAQTDALLRAASLIEAELEWPDNWPS